MMKSVVTATLLLACGTAFAYDHWTGGGGDNNWTNAANWNTTAKTIVYLDNFTTASDIAVLHEGDSDTINNFLPGGSGVVDITIKGTLNVTGTTKLSDGAGKNCIFTVDGGTWNLSNYLYVAGLGTASAFPETRTSRNRGRSSGGTVMSAFQFHLTVCVIPSCPLLATRLKPLR